MRTRGDNIAIGLQMGSRFATWTTFVLYSSVAVSMQYLFQLHPVFILCILPVFLFRFRDLKKGSIMLRQQSEFLQTIFSLPERSKIVKTRTDVVATCCSLGVVRLTSRHLYSLDM